MKSIHCYLGFSHFMGIGPITFDALLEHFGNVEKAYCADFKELLEVLGEKLAQEFDEFRNKFDATQKHDELEKKQIQIIAREDEYFPQALRDIKDVPICLYAKGDLSLIDFQKDRCVAIVGTRKATAYGLQNTKQFASQLATAGIVIVSGLATGIDAKAHWTALDSGGKTVAFLGCGVDRAFPVSNYGLYQKIIEGGGLMMSEFPPGMFAQKGTFVSRNRLISGLSEAVLVVEGSKTSGALITAKCAAEQGKEVFAIPGIINSELTEGPHILIKNGAQLATSAQDIFDALSMKCAVTNSHADSEKYNHLSKQELLIISSIKKGNTTVDEIGQFIEMPIYQVLQAVSMLEIQGLVAKNSDGRIVLK